MSALSLAGAVNDRLAAAGQAGHVVEEHALYARAHRFDRVPAPVAREKEIALVVFAKMILFQKREAEHGPVRVHEPRRLDGFVRELDEILAVGELRARDAVAGEIRMAVEPAFGEMVQLFRRQQIGDGLILTGFLAVLRAEIVRAMIEAPDFGG